MERRTFVATLGALAIASSLPSDTLADTHFRIVHTMKWPTKAAGAHTAFYYRRPPRAKDGINYQDVVYPDGRQATEDEVGTRIRCGTCGQPFNFDDFLPEGVDF